MTHASVPPAMRQAMGLTDSLVRLSCGVEDADDLIADLDQAFARQPLIDDWSSQNETLAPALRRKATASPTRVRP